MTECRLIADTRDQLGEGPVFVARENALRWVDIFGKSWHRFDLGSGALRSIELPEGLTAYAPRRAGGFVGTFESGFALLCEDPDAPSGIWHHWAIFDIPGDQRALAMSYGRDDAPSGPRQALNDFHKQGYDGPCPPRGGGSHRYFFRLLALSVEHLPLKKHPSCASVAEAAKSRTVAAALLMGRYER